MEVRSNAPRTHHHTRPSFGARPSALARGTAVNAEEKLSEIRVILQQVLDALERAEVNDQRDPELIHLVLATLVTISRLVCVERPVILN